MMPTLPMTSSQNLSKVRRVNANNSSFPSRVPTKVDPRKAEADDRAAGLTGSATMQEVLRMRGETHAVSQNLLYLVPYGTGSNNHTFSLRVVAWHSVGPPDNDPNKNLWVPHTLCELAVTLSSTQPGVAGTQVVATELFADTISITSGDSSLVKVYSPANDTGAWAVVDTLGAPLVEVTFNINSGSTTDMNALYKTL